MTERPLQNRVHPTGKIVTTPQRGLFYGNRGGKIHDQKTRRLHPTKRWASRQWICCVLQFKQRRRPIMGPGYTELFFMDEVTALATGHRPCFECRRADAVKFAKAWMGTNTRATAPDMDRILHQERLDGKSKRTNPVAWQNLPFGAMVQAGDQVLAKTDHGSLIWSFGGYTAPPNSIGEQLSSMVDCLTPPSILNALQNGYRPHWHPSAGLG